MSAWIKTGLHAGHKQLRNNPIAVTLLVRRWPEPVLAPQTHHADFLYCALATERSSGRQ
jgi:hypothetical protein